MPTHHVGDQRLLSIVHDLGTQYVGNQTATSDRQLVAIISNAIFPSAKFTKI